MAGELSTSATGESYPDAPYQTDVIIELSYYSADADGVVSVTETIELNVEAATGLDLIEESVLDFGRLAATAAPGVQASMVLSPDGTVTTSNSGAARVVAISGSSPALISVQGAAALYDLVISVQSTPIYLTHETLPGSPRFEITDFKTIPAGIGRSDRDGNLEIQVGATLNTEDVTPSQAYPDGNYSGTYILTVEY